MTETISFLPELERASGRLDYPLTNDYIFRSLCQKNNKALKGLISALLRIPLEQIRSAVIMNPIVVGEAYSSKEFRMDVHVELNGSLIINLEMQIRNEHDWPERSTSYLCRIFDSLSHGDDYTDVMAAVHIGILDFTPFPEMPSFYSCNKLMDLKTHHIYSDKFCLNVLDLSKASMATDEDRQWKLDYWARLFKATTWEEIKMTAADNEYLKEASNTLYCLNTDFEVRERARNREEYYRALKKAQDIIDGNDRELAQKEHELEQINSQLAQVNRQLYQMGDQLAQKNDQLAQKDDQLAQINRQLNQKDDQLAQKDDQLAQKDDQLAQINRQLNQKDDQLAQINRQLNQKDDQIEHLKAVIANLTAEQRN